VQCLHPARLWHLVPLAAVFALFAAGACAGVGSGEEPAGWPFQGEHVIVVHESAP
jgi:hypothetical protein